MKYRVFYEIQMDVFATLTIEAKNMEEAVGKVKKMRYFRKAYLVPEIGVWIEGG
jgi:hypothetical protein